jgi:hypothetical protein
MDNRSDKVKESYQISNCRFGLGKAMMVGMEFNEMRNMVMNYAFEYLREVIKNANGSVVAHRGVIAALKYMDNGRFLPRSRELLHNQAQAKYMPKDRQEDFRTTFYHKPRDIIKSNR